MVGMRLGVQPILFRPTFIDDCELWWEPGTTISQGTVMAGTPSVFTTLPNLGNYGGTFDAAGGVRPTVAYLEAGGISRRVALFDDSDDYHESNLAASAWAQAHQAWTWIIALRPSAAGRVISTCATSSETGAIVQVAPVTGTATLYVADGGAPYIANITTPNDSVPQYEVSILTITYSQAAGAKIRVNGTEQASDTMGAPSVGAPTGTLHLGSDTALGNPLGGQLALVLGYSRVLTASEIATLEAHYAVKYQGQNALMDLTPTFYFDGGLGVKLDPDNAEAGDQVLVHADQSGFAHDASQSTDNQQLTFDRIDTTFGSESSLEGDGTADCMALSAGAGWPAAAATSHLVIWVGEQQNVGTQLEYLVDFQTGLLVFANDTATGLMRIYDGVAWRNVGHSVEGAQDIEFMLDSVGGTSEAYRAGVFLGSSVYAAQTIGGDVVIFANDTQLNRFVNGKYSILLEKSDATLPTSYDLYLARVYRANRFPTLWADSLPLLSPGAQVWYNPTDVNNVTKDGADRVSQVDDTHATVLSGAQLHATQGVGADQPLWVADAGDGVPALRFDASNTEKLDTALVANATAGTIIGWAKTSSFASYRIFLGASTGAAFLQVYADISSGEIKGSCGNAAIVTGITPTLDTWVQWALTWDSGTYVWYVNGSTGTGAYGGALPTHTLAIGSRNDSGSYTRFHDGDLGQLEVADRAFTATEITTWFASTAR